MKFLRRVAPAIAAAVCLPSVICLVAGQDLSRNRSPRITQAIDENRLITLKGNTHPLARAEFDRGAARADLPMDRMLLVLKRSPEQDAALKGLLENQQVKSSPEYRHWLTPEEFGQRFGPADQDIQTVTFWLRSHGFRVNSVAKGRTVIEFSGNAGQVAEAFHTTIHSFVVKGEQHWANTTDPRIPVALAPVVAGVATLNNFRPKPVAGKRDRLFGTSGKVGARPKLNVTDGRHALVPSDYAAIYNIKPLYQAGINGTGRTIAVVGTSNFDPLDVANFRQLFGVPVNPPQIIVNGPDPGNLGGGDEMEAVLDATWAGAVAPGATVKFVVSADTDAAGGLDLSEQYVVDNNLADVITESFGSCEAFLSQLQAVNRFLEGVREQAAAQGMTFIVSTGDSGAYNCDDFDTELSVAEKPSVNARAASPYVVAVGGTQFNEGGNDSAYWNLSDFPGHGSALSYIPENAWNQSCNSAECFGNIVAGGGGPSSLFPKPSWQSGIYGMPGDGARDLPDVSLTAAWDHDAYVLCLEGDCQLDSSGGFSFSLSGGTSAAAPSFAGMIALLAQKMNSRLGQVNPVLYGLAATEQFGQCNGSAGPPASDCIFNDVTQGNTGVPGEPGYGTDGVGYKAGQGYDLATGLGSVNLANLATQWSAINRTATTTTFSILPSSFTHGATGTVVRVFVSPGTGAGVPTGQVSLLSSAGIWAGSLALTNGSATFQDAVFPGGSYTVTAHYPGDATFAPSDSAPVSLIVSPEVSKTALAVLDQDFLTGYAPITSSPYGSFVYLSAGVAGASGAGLRPTGSIMFLDNGASIDGNPYLLNSSGGTLTLDGINSLSVGQHSIVASYSGDPSYNAGASAPASLVITKASTFLSLDPKCVSSGTTTTVDANIDTLSLGDSPTGTVSFSAGGKPLGGPLPLSADWTASLPISLLVTGANIITANYSGDSNYLASTVTQPVIVGGGECVGAAVDGASYYPTLAPDGLASIFGNALAAAPQYASSLQLPTTLAGTTVTVTDSAGHSAAAPLAFISQGQINCVIPLGMAPGMGTLQVTSSTTSDQMPVDIEKIAPAIFSADSSGFGLAAAQIVRAKPDGKQDTESTVTLDSKGNIIPVPVTFYADKLVLVLYATGVRHNSGLSNVRVFFNGQAKIPFYAGAQNQFEGLDQINVNLPPVLSGQGPVDVYVTVDGQPSNDVTVVFK